MLNDITTFGDTLDIMSQNFKVQNEVFARQNLTLIKDVEQLKEDVDLKIKDYSFLIGLHNLDSQNVDPTKKSFSF